jgi:hypothetical protein
MTENISVLSCQSTIIWGTWLSFASACMTTENKVVLRKFVLLMLLILQEMFHLSQINIPAIQSNSGLSTYDNAATKSVSIAARL